MLIDIELDDVEFYSNVEQVGRYKYANVCRNKITSKHLLINMIVHGYKKIYEGKRTDGFTKITLKI